MTVEPATTTGADRDALGSAALASGTIDAVPRPSSPRVSPGSAR